MTSLLEDWFDPRRLKDDYVPTGFKGYGVQTRAVKGHEFGLKLSPDDKRALIAFLKRFEKSREFQEGIMTRSMFWTLNRRRFFAFAAAGLVRAGDEVTSPSISEEVCPLQRIAPEARDGHRGLCFLRKPPGGGPFPAVLIIHGGLTTWREEDLKTYSLNGATPSRFLAAGYAVLATTYRSRDGDPQSKVSLEDCLAAIDYLRRLPSVDPKSIIAYGCSGGGDLALEIAAATDVSAIVAEEPASFIFAGIFNASFPKKGERYTPQDSAPIGEDPKRFYTPEYQKFTRGKIARIRCPILILQGDKSQGQRAGPSPVVPFNNQVLIPELLRAGKTVEQISYPGEPHCFCFYGSGPRSPRPAAALKAFHDIDAFCKRNISTKPKLIDSSLVKATPLN
jgi:dipeptidyl aminopeptidase/acylaminoacyl peptidase